MTASNAKEANIREPSNGRVSSETVGDVGQANIGAVTLDVQWQKAVDKNVGSEEGRKDVAGYRNVAQRRP